MLSSPTAGQRHDSARRVTRTRPLPRPLPRRRRDRQPRPVRRAPVPRGDLPARRARRSPTQLAAFDVRAWSLPDPDGRLGAVVAKQVGAARPPSAAVYNASRRHRRGRGAARRHRRDGRGRASSRSSAPAAAAPPGCSSTSTRPVAGRGARRRSRSRDGAPGDLRRGAARPRPAACRSARRSRWACRPRARCSSAAPTRCSACSAAAASTAARSARPRRSTRTASTAAARSSSRSRSRGAASVHTFVVNQTMPAPFVAPLPDRGARHGRRRPADAAGRSATAPTSRSARRVELVLRKYAHERGVPVYGFKARARTTKEEASMSWNKVAVVGAGLIKMGELFEQSYEQMAAGAFDAAVASVDKGFEPHQVEAAFVATQRGTLWGQEGIGGNTIPTAIGLAGIPCTRIENACPSGSDAFRVGAMAVASGVHDVVLVIGVEKMRDKSTEEGLLSRAAAGHPIFTRGETAPVLFAPFATRHMHEFGTTREMLASVAVKNHYNGARDPYAHFQNEITVEDVLKSPAGVPSAAPPRLLPADRRRGRGAARAAPTGRASSPTSPCTSPGSASRPTTRTCTRRTRFTEIKVTRLAVAARVRDGRRRPGRHRLRRGARLLHDHRDPRHRRPRLLREGRRRPRQPRRRDLADRPHPGQHVAAGCSRRATRSARPASPRSPSAGGSCAARPANARSRPATATRCSTTPAAAARASSVVNILTNRNDAS